MNDESPSMPATVEQVNQILVRMDRLATEVRKVRSQRSEGVSLGCGGLIAMAFVVWLLSGKIVRDLELEVFGLRNEVRELKAAVESQTTEIHQLRDRLPPHTKAEDANGKK